MFGDGHPFTHLVPDLKGVDPDDAFSTVPYEKGSNLLFYLEQLLGGPGACDSSQFSDLADGEGHALRCPRSRQRSDVKDRFAAVQLTESSRFAATFEPFLRAYIHKFKYKSITTSEWKSFLYEFFADKVCWSLSCLDQ